MKLNDNTIGVLNDLIQINNDRIEGYEKAAAETKPEDNDLRSLFNNMASESRQYVNELTRHVARTDDEPAAGTTLKGKIYRAWMDVKATFTGKDRKSILASCEFGEDAAQRAYEQGLDEDGLDSEIRQLLTTQKQKLRASHDKIKAMRDTQPA
ncbi:MAG TPA: PA2169 family four-helix-bundle protein [Chitinophagaceae bacterium]